MNDLERKVFELIRESPDPLNNADISRRLGVVEQAGSFPLTATALGTLSRRHLIYVRFGRWYVDHEEARSRARGTE